MRRIAESRGTLREVAQVQNWEVCGHSTSFDWHEHRLDIPHRRQQVATLLKAALVKHQSGTRFRRYCGVGLSATLANHLSVLALAKRRSCHRMERVQAIWGRMPGWPPLGDFPSGVGRGGRDQK